MKGIFGILRWRFLGTMTYSSSKPQSGLCLNAPALLIRGFVFSDSAIYCENGEKLKADDALDACEKISEDDAECAKE